MLISRAVAALALLALFAAGSAWAGLPQAGIQWEPTTVAVDGRKYPQYEARIGRILLPENRSSDQSRRIEIAFIHIKSPNPNPGPPLFVLGAGPGGSGLREAQNVVEEFPGLIDSFDLVGMDQRGTGLSRPNLGREFAASVDNPTTRKRVLRAYEGLVHQAREYWEEGGVDLRGYNTREAADDIDAIRQALGYEKIGLFGFSYGSHLGLAIIRRHGEHIARVALLAIEGPDHTFKTPGQTQEGLENVARLVAQDAQLSGGILDLVDLVRRVLDRVERDPPRVDLQLENGERRTVTVTPLAVQEFVASRVGRRRSIRTLPASLVAMDRGDFSEVARIVLRFRRTVTIWSTMAHVTDCASGASAERRALMRAQATETLLGDAASFPFPYVCEAWGVPQLDDSFRAPLRSDVPTLFVAGTLDARTPVSNAEEVAAGFSNGHLLIVENAGHDVWPTDHVTRFLKGEPLNEERIVDPPVEFAAIPD